ncbi:MAG TPA: cytochrome c-type biogenesis protein CcmH [Thermoleophilaceae bacterium]
MRRVAGVVAALVLLWAPAAAFADCPRTTVADLEDEVMCQVCGVPLGLAGDAPQAERERAFIARQVGRCLGKREIERSLVAQFGPSVLADPPHEGFALSAYLVPALAVLGAAALLIGWLGMSRRRGRESDPSAPTLSASERERVDAALERWSTGRSL